MDSTNNMTALVEMTRSIVVKWTWMCFCRMAADFMKMDYLFLAVGVVGGACSDVQQTFIQVTKFSKREQLLDILKTTGNASYISQPYTKFRLSHFKFEINSAPNTGIHCRSRAHHGVCGDQETSGFYCCFLVPGKDPNYQYSRVSWGV